MNFYSIRHLTRFRYSRPISESIMETRMHPRSDALQHCLAFSLSVSPRCRVFTYRDHLGNNVHHFDIPGDHTQLIIVAESIVEQQTAADVPAFLSPDAWRALDEMVQGGDYSEMLLPSTYAIESAALLELAGKLEVRRRDDPMMLVHELNQRLFEYFEYVPKSTRVDSPIDLAIESHMGVCQDFAHTMIALLRHVGIPARYVSGYLYRSREDHDRSTPDATHAWVDVLLPYLGWVGFDPTNNLVAHHRHIRTAVGRDYADVPPTRGIFRGKTESELYVAVHVEAGEKAPELDRNLPIPEDWSVLVERAQEPVAQVMPTIEIQQMQQQQ
ncbi:transglutaminase family protein [Terracidiphilus gabretensis]|uniref:transglutaminase family protein n=1 Tax=Terracidiphilus gabretensis TaxID=1577687 RepID=UPI00071B06F3|nr:transglutaminase family protein [Terracidiphilus gabretensis]